MLKQKLRELRTKKKLTQKELSEKLGLSKNAVCEYEKGRSEPSIETLIKLSRIFEVSLDYLVEIPTFNIKKSYYLKKHGFLSVLFSLCYNFT